jgi:hypothetical protein
MNYELFEKTLMSYKKFLINIDAHSDFGVESVSEGPHSLDNHAEELISSFITSHYGEEGWEWVSWFIYESKWGEKDWSVNKTYKIREEGGLEEVDKGDYTKYGAFDKDGNPICYSFESLYHYLEKEFKK